MQGAKLASERGNMDEPDDQPLSETRQSKSIVEFFRESPLVGVELDLDRDKDPGRDIDL